MSHQNISIAQSMLDCATKLKSEFMYGERFVVLTGETGSGRTNMCEHVVNALESKFTTIFIPCQNQMTMQQLRQLFLQQVSPTEKWDDSLPLSQSFSQLSIPVRQKLLVVVDDIDLVLSTFFDEVVSLYEQSLGQNRFSFLVTAHPLWTQTKLSEIRNDKLVITEVAMPQLTMDESLQICQQMFVFAGLEKIYNVLLPKLPRAFESCEGNVSKVIKLTEIFMSDPINADKETPKLNEQKKVDAPKKRNSTGIFISIICVVIVLACLVPIFLGTNVVDKVLGNDEATQNVEKPIAPNATDGNDLSFGDSKDDLKASEDPLAVSAAGTTDIKAEGPQGDASNAAEDAGGLLPKIEEGVVAEDSNNKAKNSVTLQGETLDAIEGKEADTKSEDPRQGLAGTVENKTAAPTQTAKDSATQTSQEPVVTLQRANNALFEEQIRKEDEAKALAIAKKLEEQKAAESAKAAQEAKAQAVAQQEQAKVAATTAATEDTASTKQVAATKKATTKKAVARPRGNPIPGATSELNQKNSNHYTLQVLAGRDRGALLRAADYVDGRYWIYTTVRDERAWYVLVVGDFASPNAALRNARNLPAYLRAAGPFAKTFDRVQTEMRMR